MSAYQIAKIARDQLIAETRAASAAFKPFDHTRNAIGLYPDHVRLSPEFRVVKVAYDKAFAAQRAFNGPFNKKFKTEILQERRKKQKEREATIPNKPRSCGA